MSDTEIRRTDDDFAGHVADFALLLDMAGIAHATYAAEMSAHKILALDARMIHDRCVGLGPQGIGVITPRGAEMAGELGLDEDVPADRYTLWVIDSWRSGAGWLARGALHDVGYLNSADHLLEGWQEVDAVAIAEFINRVEIARGADWGHDPEAYFADMRARVADVSTDFGPRAAAK